MKFKNNYIKEIELDTCDFCGANCIMCSEPHGCQNTKIMQPETFNILLDQLKDVNYELLHSSGNGETFINPHYLDYVRKLKKEFPDKPRYIYNNFSLLNKERADIIVNENLFNRVHMRVDSLQEWIFKKSSGLNMNKVLENLKYFCSINDKIPLTILYNNIVDYYNRCKALFGKRPKRDRFTDEELAKIKNEQSDIRNYILPHMKNPNLLAMAKIGHCCWAERYRNDIQFKPLNKCPKINVIKNVCWVYPSGKIGMCCFNDEQKDNFILGDIHENHILDIFYGEKRMDLLSKISNLDQNNPFSDGPCFDPRLCAFGSGADHKIESK